MGRKTVPSSVPCNDFSGTVEEIDEKIRETEALIRKATAKLPELKSRRNLRVPICRLPVEILGRILVFTLEYSGNPQYQRRYPLVMSVCRLWRMVAMDTPAVWSKPNFHYPEWAREAIKYSRSAPLAIEWSSYPGPLQKHFDVMYEVVAQCSTRISSLDIVCYSSSFYLTKLLSKMVHPAPYIHFIRLETSCKPDFTIPDDFLGGDAPRLLHFELQGCNVPWVSPILWNLTTLIIIQPSWSGANTSIDGVSATLQAATMLEVLEFSDVLPPDTSALLPRGTRIELPRLKSLHLSSRGGTSVPTLLQHMTFPKSATIHLVVEHLKNVEDLLADGLASVFSDSSTTSAEGSRTVRSLVLRRSKQTGLVIQAWDTITDERRRSLPDQFPPQFHCELGPDGWSGSALSFLKRLLPMFGPLSDLERLEIGLFGTLEDIQGILIPRFSKHSLLHTIFIVDDGCVFEVVELLSYNLLANLNTARTDKEQRGKDKGKRKRVSTDAMVFPSLRTVGIFDVYFDDLMPVLIESLKLRSKCGYSVNHVLLEGCNHLFGDDVVDLEAKVRKTNVIWDGLEMETEEDEESSDYNSQTDDSDEDEDLDDYPYYVPDYRWHSLIY